MQRLFSILAALSIVVMAFAAPVAAQSGDEPLAPLFRHHLLKRVK
jgi:hypothetical protein